MVKGSTLIKKYAKYWLFLDNYLKFIFSKLGFVFLVFFGSCECIKTHFLWTFIHQVSNWNPNSDVFSKSVFKNSFENLFSNSGWHFKYFLVLESKKLF